MDSLGRPMQSQGSLEWGRRVGVRGEAIAKEVEVGEMGLQAAKCRQPPEAGKRMKMNYSSETPERTQPCQHMLDFWPLEL